MSLSTEIKERSALSFLVSGHVSAIMRLANNVHYWENLDFYIPHECRVLNYLLLPLPSFYIYIYKY